MLITFDLNIVLAVVIGWFSLNWIWKRLFPYKPHYRIIPEKLNDLKLIPKISNGSTKVEQVAQLVRDMRTVYESGYSRPLKKRLEQLNCLERMLIENEKRLCDAIKDDLGRVSLESSIYDVWVIVSHIRYIKRRLQQWMEPEVGEMEILAIPMKSRIYYDPLGVSLIIGMWNYPVLLSILPLVGSICGGNTTVLQLSMRAKKSALLLTELVAKYLDPLCVQTVKCDGNIPMSKELLKQKFDVLFFTGSTNVGKIIMKAAAENLTKCILELGGQNPVFVDNDYDLDVAAKRILLGRCMNAGQQCVSPNYVLCHEDVIDELCEKMKTHAKDFYGKNLDGIGYMVDEEHYKSQKKILNLFKNGPNEERVLGGILDDEKLFISPTVLKVNQNSEVLNYETFSAILSVTPVKNVDEAIDYINRKEKPLSLYLFSNTYEHQQKILNNTSSGTACVNATLYQVMSKHGGFGGVGASGMGAHFGRNSFNAFTHRKSVLYKLWLPDFGLLSDCFLFYPPWDTKLKEAIVPKAFEYLG